MSISQNWRAKESYEYSWSVAQVKSPLADVFASLSRARNCKDTKQKWNGESFEIKDTHVGHLIIYSRASSEWTFVESLMGALLPYKGLLRASKTLQADVLAVDYCYDMGGVICSHYQSGAVREEYTTANDVEDFHFKTTDGKQRKWQTNEAETVFRYGKRESALDLTSSPFEDWWNEISEFLELEVPFLCWTNWKSNDSIGINLSEMSDLTGAHLFSTP